ncbi:acetyltransferase, GNAT family [Anaerofustis stercorihominis DSM 17244]|uniref:Acetyltransferase, GNAT family n=2 Tax=Anaerofustis stercorihominis TaxID=214853 RepID=B1C929_9FIRM|nr:acetyltransferase, GNAT family [Anaerofustis stercorihominis DSM 17244]
MKNNMKKNYIIRKETKEDYKETEYITREAFFNVYQEGCFEHYILNKLHSSKDYIKELAFVVEKNNKLIGHIGYTHSKLISSNNDEKNIISFGPVSIIPEYKMQGIGSKLIIHSIAEAKKLAHKAIVIYGNPKLYQHFGFTLGIKYGIKTAEGKNAVPLLAMELEKGYLNDADGYRFMESQDFEINEQEFNEYDKSFPYKEKKKTESQTEFEIISNLMW